MQKYPSGSRGSPAKGVVRETVARVQIPPSAPSEYNPNLKPILVGGAFGLFLFYYPILSSYIDDFTLLLCYNDYMNIKTAVKYLIITFAITYACWWGVAALVAYTDLVYGDVLPTILYIIGNFGPAISALLCIGGRPYLRSLKEFLFSYKKHGLWIFLLFVALVTLTVGLSSMEWNPQMTALNFMITLLGSTFIYGGEEELGWRGILQPILSKKITFPLAALACGVIWALWHLPLWFIEGHPNQSMPFWVQATLGIFLCFWLGIIYERSKCLPLCMLFHGFVNVMLSSFVLKLNWILILGIILTTAAAIVLWLLDIKRAKTISNQPTNTK